MRGHFGVRAVGRGPKSKTKFRRTRAGGIARARSVRGIAVHGGFVWFWSEATDDFQTRPQSHCEQGWFARGGGSSELRRNATLKQNQFQHEIQTT